MKNKKTLLFFSPAIEGGGVEKNLFNITNFFCNNINDIYLITANSNKKKLFNQKINFISPKLNYWSHSNRFFKTFISIVLFIKFFIKKKDKIVIFSFNSNLYAIILAKIFNCKVIIRSNAAPIGYSKKMIKKKFFTFFLKFADLVIVNSYEFKKEMKKQFNISAICIYNPLEKIDRIIKNSKKKIILNFFQKNTLNIISIGRLVKQKDHLTLLKAISKLNKKIKLNLLIVGDGEEKKNIVKYIIENKLQKVVKIIKFKKNPYPYLQKSDILVLSSLYEGLPNVLIEALALKKFVISSNCQTGPKEILANQKYGSLFNVKDYLKLEEKIYDFYKNKKKLRKKTLLAFNSLDRFDFNKNCTTYLNTVKEYL